MACGVTFLATNIFRFCVWRLLWHVTGGDFTPELFDTWYKSVPVLLSASVISPVITLPLLALATGEKSWSDRFNFWAVKVTNKKLLFNWFVLFLIFWTISLFLAEWLQLPEEQFMIDLKAANNSIERLLLILTAICIVLPVMEELVFRGWLYSKILFTKFTNKGALLVTSVIFTVSHSQYENSFTIMMLFLLSLLLGLVRYKTNNISYSILSHMLFNNLSMIFLF